MAELEAEIAGAEIYMIDTEGKVSFFRYVAHHEVRSYLVKGWNIVDNLAGTPHGDHAVLMVWEGEGEPS